MSESQPFQISSFNLSYAVEFTIHACISLVTGGVRIIAPFFIYFFYLIATIVFRSFLIVVYRLSDYIWLPFWLIFLAIGLYSYFMIILNYSLSILVKPGSLDDLYKSQVYKEISPYLSEAVNLEYIPVAPPENERPGRCRTCKDVKVTRSHHCSVCGICVFKMDHHCVWINNCVGLQNHRYFLLFLFWTYVGALFSFLVFQIAIWEKIRIEEKFVIFTYYLVGAGCLILTFFNGMQLFLTCRGETTIEFWSGKSKNDVSFGDRLENNLLVIFGSNSLWRCLLLPSIKSVPLSGLEWMARRFPEFKLGRRNFYETV